MSFLYDEIVSPVMGWTIGLAKCSKCGVGVGVVWAMSLCGVKIVSAVASSRIVNTLMACCVTNRWRARVGMAVVVVRGDTRRMGVGMGGSCLCILGTAPGVLFRVTRR